MNPVVESAASHGTNNNNNNLSLNHNPVPMEVEVLEDPPADSDNESEEEEEPELEHDQDHEPDDLHSVVENHLQNIRQLTQLLTGLTRENSPDWLLNELANLLPTYINLKTRLGRLDPKILENNICLMHLNTQVDEMMVLAEQFSIPWEQAPTS